MSPPPSCAAPRAAKVQKRKLEPMPNPDADTDADANPLPLELALAMLPPPPPPLPPLTTAYTDALQTISMFLHRPPMFSCGTVCGIRESGVSVHVVSLQSPSTQLAFRIHLNLETLDAGTPPSLPLTFACGMMDTVFRQVDTACRVIAATAAASSSAAPLNDSDAEARSAALLLVFKSATDFVPTGPIPQCAFRIVPDIHVTFYTARTAPDADAFAAGLVQHTKAFSHAVLRLSVANSAQPLDVRNVAAAYYRLAAAAAAAVMTVPRFQVTAWGRHVPALDVVARAFGPIVAHARSRASAVFPFALPADMPASLDIRALADAVPDTCTVAVMSTEADCLGRQDQWLVIANDASRSQ